MQVALKLSASSCSMVVIDEIEDGEPLSPPVLWAQRKETISLKVNISEPKVTFAWEQMCDCRVILHKYLQVPQKVYFKLILLTIGTASLLGTRHLGEIVENKLASSFVVSLGKALNRTTIFMWKTGGP